MCTFAGISFTKLMSIIALNMAVNACGFVIYSMDVNSMNVNAAAGLEHRFFMIILTCLPPTVKQMYHGVQRGLTPMLNLNKN